MWWILTMNRNKIIIKNEMAKAVLWHELFVNNNIIKQIECDVCFPRFCFSAIQHWKIGAHNTMQRVNYYAKTFLISHNTHTHTAHIFPCGLFSIFAQWYGCYNLFILHIRNKIMFAWTNLMERRSIYMEHWGGGMK